MRRSVLGPGAVLSFPGASLSAATAKANVGDYVGRLVPQPHGGALLPGGTGKGGRPKSSIRAIARKELRKRIGHLSAFADGVAVSLVDDETSPEAKQKLVTHAVKVETRVKALEVLAKIAGDNTVSMGEVKARLKRQVEVIRQTLPPEQANAVLDALAAVWR